MESVDINVDALKTPIPIDSPEQIMDCASRAEAIGISVAEQLRVRNEILSGLNKKRTLQYASALSEFAGEKVAVAQAKAAERVSDVDNEIAIEEAQIMYLKYVGNLVDRRCSLCQSFLSNMTAMAKAGNR